MPDKQDVKSDSSADKKGVEGGSPSADELLANGKAENERKQGEIQSLKEKLSENQEELTELREIKRQYGELTAQQQKRQEALKREGTSIEDEIHDLRRKPENKTFFTHLDTEIKNAEERGAMKGSQQALLELAKSELEDTAEELSEKEEFKGMTDEKLLKLIKPFWMDYATENPYVRVKKSIRDWKKHTANKSKSQEEARKAAESASSQEMNGRRERESTAQDLLKKNGDLNSSEKSELREKLGLVSRPGNR